MTGNGKRETGNVLRYAVSRFPFPASRIALTLVLASSLARPAAAQSLFEQFSYAGLRLSGLGVEMGGVISDRLTREPSPGLRVDLGVLAPRLRVVFGGSYFRGEFNADQITRFEQRLRGVVVCPSADCTIDVGSITWTELEIDGDFQYLFPAGRTQTYFGLGIGVHLRDGDGGAIDGTFVEDALDTVAAGVNLSAGLEVALVSHLAATVDLRGALTSELRLASARGGLKVRFPAPGR